MREEREGGKGGKGARSCVYIFIETFLLPVRMVHVLVVL